MEVPPGQGAAGSHHLPWAFSRVQQVVGKIKRVGESVQLVGNGRRRYWNVASMVPAKRRLEYTSEKRNHIMADEKVSADAIADHLNRLDCAGRHRFLALLAHQLRISARETYEIGTEEVVEPRHLRRYNEVMHRVLSNSIDLLDGRRDDVWCWDLVIKESQELRSIVAACRSAFELTRLKGPIDPRHCA